LGLMVAGCAVTPAPPIDPVATPATTVSLVDEAPQSEDAAVAEEAAAASALEVGQPLAEVQVLEASPPDMAVSQGIEVASGESPAVVEASPPDVAPTEPEFTPAPDVVDVQAPSPDMAATPLAVPQATITVEGYVINHREGPVDGSRTSRPLAVAAENEVGLSVFASVESNGYFELAGLPAGNWNFVIVLPEDWSGVVPLATRGGTAQTGFTRLDDSDQPYRVVFKLRRLVDVGVLKWEELADGSVQPGAGWAILASPQGDPFVKAVGGETGTDGYLRLSLTPGIWTFSEAVKPGWEPVTPAEITLELDQYGPSPVEPLVFKNRVRP